MVGVRSEDLITITLKQFHSRGSNRKMVRKGKEFNSVGTIGSGLPAVCELCRVGLVLLMLVVVCLCVCAWVCVCVCVLGCDSVSSRV